MRSGRYTGLILLADISGYSSFLNDVQVAHATDAFADGQIPQAYAMMAGLLEGIASMIDPPLTFLKFEGDAAFAVAPEAVMPRGAEMLACIDNCYANFVEQRASAEGNWTCTCSACSRKDGLDLKFIVHHGEYFVQEVGGNLDAVGPEVNLAHRLLKNTAASVLNSTGYALFTEDTVDALDLPLSDAARSSESLDNVRPIDTRVIPLPGTTRDSQVHS